MTEPLKYIITYDELMTLIQSNDVNERMKIIVTVTSHQYREKSAGEAVAGGAVKIAGGAAGLLGGLMRELAKEDPPHKPRDAIQRKGGKS